MAHDGEFVLFLAFERDGRITPIARQSRPAIVRLVLTSLLADLRAQEAREGDEALRARWAREREQFERGLAALGIGVPDDVAVP